ncbi:glutaminyl-peptide cyclotransferase, isoform CRA_b [Phycomyces nitens]|nr:glutaminyl-peptide cyclotransferase, isoform CRA_b [Phycomyces nitens]
MSVPDRFSVNGNLLKPLLIPRVAGSVGNQQVREYIFRHFTKLNWTVELDSFVDQTPFGEKSFVNIVATKNPAAKRKLVMAAHYDSKYFDQFEFIGATDSAVPCGILMDIASTLDKQLSKQTSTTLQIIFFDGEEAFVNWTVEDSVYGARHLARKWEKDIGSRWIKGNTRLGEIDMLILLDLLGTPNPVFADLYRSTSWAFKQLVVLEERLGNLGLFKSHSKDNQELKPMFNPDSVFTFTSRPPLDDHLPFIHRGVSILHIIPTIFPAVWHNSMDNADCVDPATVEKFAILFRSFVVEYLELD